MNVERIDQVINLFGAFDENMKLVEKELGVSVVNRETELKISGESEEAVALAERTIAALAALCAKGEPITTQSVQYVMQLVRDGQEEKLQELGRDVVCITAKGKPVRAKTLGQKKYLQAMKENTITMGIGPAGTGKTVPGGGHGGGRLPRQARQPDHPDPAGGGGGGKAGLSAGRFAEQGGPLPAPALRRAV